VGEDGIMPVVSHPLPSRRSRLVYVHSFQDQISGASIPQLPARQPPRHPPCRSLPPERKVCPSFRRMATAWPFGRIAQGEMRSGSLMLTGLNPISLEKGPKAWTSTGYSEDRMNQRRKVSGKKLAVAALNPEFVLRRISQGPTCFSAHAGCLMRTTEIDFTMYCGARLWCERAGMILR
jgi:hypothetical protein